MSEDLPSRIESLKRMNRRLGIGLGVCVLAAVAFFASTVHQSRQLGVLRYEMEKAKANLESQLMLARVREMQAREALERAKRDLAPPLPGPVIP